MIANDSIIHRLRIPRECIYFPGSRHSQWIDCGLYSNTTFKRLTDRKRDQEAGMDATITCKKMKVCAYPWGYLAVTRIPARATLGEPTFPVFPYKTWQTFYMRNERLVRIDALLLLGTRSGRGSRRPVSEVW